MKNKLNIVLIVMFLCGAMIFLLPILSQIQEVEQDDQEYAAMLEQFKSPEPSPSPTTTPDTPEPDPSLVDTTEEPTGDPVPTMLPVLVEVPQSTESTGIIPSPTPEPEPSPTQNPHTTATVLPRVTATPAATGIDALITQNKDFVAWITIPGTPVDYPVVSSNNTEYYLHHLFNGKESKLGCLFSLKSSDYDSPGRNIAIYGHHLSNSTAMFSSLIKYKDSGYYASHSRIQLETINETRTYRIFAVLNIDVSDWDPATATFASDKEFLHFVNRAKEKALYDTGVSVGVNDNILTLITCDRSYGGASGRLIVMAVQE